MKISAWLGLLLTVTGWGLFALTAMNLLSGHLDERSCQTDCVQMMFYSAVVAGFAGLILSGISLIRPPRSILGIASTILAFPLCAIFTVFLITAFMS